MILFGLAVAAALGCTLAALERLRKVLAVRRAIAAELREVLVEVRAGRLSVEAALAQLLFEADFAFSRWKLVPRMAGRISSSCGFLLAAAQLRSVLIDLGDAPLEGAGEPLVIGAVQIVAAALAGTSLCLAFGREAERARRGEAARVDAWLEGAFAGEDSADSSR